MNSTTLTATRTANGPVALIRFTGEIDMTNAETLHLQAREASEGAQAVVADLRDVGFFGSAGVLALEEANNDCRAHGAALRLVPSATVRRTLGMLGMLERFELYEGVDAASGQSG